MSKTLYTNKRAGVTVGHKTVFTLQGALDRYKLALELVYKDTKLDISGSNLLWDIESDLVKNCGMTWEEVEQIENEYLKTL